jgi:hypothetical protein
MRTFTLLLSALVLGTTAARAQKIATFDDLHLPKADTFYVNYSAPRTDVGFNDGGAHFPCVYDTSYGGIWSTGFAYSNMTDSVTSGFGNEYSAKAGIGYGGSANYAVAFVSNPLTFANTIVVNLHGSAIGHPVYGFYVTNNTYAYNSMRDGDFFAKKFVNGDWFLLTARGYRGGVLQPDSVGIYLADFLFPDPSDNFILDTWKWFNLLPLGSVDSLQFTLRSTDNGMYGMNTPSYFCMDNFTTTDPALSATNTVKGSIAKVYPNPATEVLYVDVTDNSVQTVTLMNMAGNIIGTYAASSHLEINKSSLPAGSYLLQFTGNGAKASARFTKQ